MFNYTKKCNVSFIKNISRLQRGYSHVNFRDGILCPHYKTSLQFEQELEIGSRN